MYGHKIMGLKANKIYAVEEYMKELKNDYPI
jgi:hypothetical protein